MVATAEQPDLSVDPALIEDDIQPMPVARVQQMVRLDLDVREMYLDGEGRMDNNRINEALRTFAAQ
jgi:uncharacterized protein (DUF4415 family)